MADETTDSKPVSETLPDAPEAAPAKQSVHSFKKKYAKLKMKFTKQELESEALIREELRIEDLSKRIQEQNDQLLEILLEFNDSLHVSPSLRYDLTMPDDATFLPPAEQEIAPLINDATLARTALKEAKSELANGNLSTSAYRQVEESVKRNKDFVPAMQYRKLIQVPHTSAGAPDQEQGSNGVRRTLGYLTPERETEYYLALDAKLGDETAISQVARIPDPPTFAEREREAVLRNPASVYNWLRRNQPQALQDHEVASEKSTSRPSNARSSKRAPAQRKEEEAFDEDGMEVEPTPKNKRKRDEDSGYRPKGGNNRSKKKKDEPTAAKSNAKKA
ncbi:uncharacterized protein N7496_005235 [Penicillium cataractarum]|uniref:IEC3 subunit of the Ino80 complex, chromatin re-modelling-domain-containing protein n=1 Tax=Penicillium cataractarum TaxID=2100454 RepID=A0A9W9SFS1_9EURO|nr:uncharacterized protein N7496_005235 [Penicillium cataractarum]KAJ5377826.1 hypothetical protein N7496_005235 [Penicillium cataractarum]